MKVLILGLFLIVMSVQQSNAQQTKTPTPQEQEIIKLSKTKWDWMAEKNVDSLNVLFDEKSMFVHMGGSWGKAQEIDVIKSGQIHYKKAEVYSVIVNIIGNTAILLNDIDLGRSWRKRSGQSFYGNGGLCKREWEMEDGITNFLTTDEAG